MCFTLCPDVILVQEHWKSFSDISDILNLSNNYIGFGISAMDSVLKRGLLVGSPFGGYAILVSH